jgi:type VI secretion system protein ImpC
MANDDQLDMSIQMGGLPAGGGLRDQTPFHILILGDFHATVHSHAPIEINDETIDRTITQLQPQVDIAFGEATISISFESMSDFHPDNLTQNISDFGPLMRLREQLQEPSTFNQAAQEVRSWSSWQPPKEAEEEATTSECDIERLLGRKPITSAGKTPSLAQDLIREIVGSSNTPQIDPQRDDLVATVDQAIGKLLQHLLHDPAFQAVEAAWRGLDFLVNQVESDGALKIFLSHLPKKKLVEEMIQTDKITQSTFYRTVVDQALDTLGASPWSLVALTAPITSADQDLVCFQRCLTLARAAQVPVIAEAVTDFAKGPEEAARWSPLRAQPEAALGGLLVAQFLLRRPYGNATDAIESFHFEEIDSQPEPANFLRGNPIWILASLLGQAYNEHGWAMQPDQRHTLDGMPTHCFESERGTEQIPSTLPTLAESDATALIQLGFMPLISTRGQDIVRIACVQSLSSPPTPLYGRWRTN